MAPLQDSAPFNSTDASNSSSEKEQDMETTLPGIKRGIAIGVACSASVIFILFLTIFAIKRRRKLARLDQQKKDDLANKVVFEEVWWQEKTKKQTQPPTPTPTWNGASMIYEVDTSSESERSANHMRDDAVQHQNCYPPIQEPHQRKDGAYTGSLPLLTVSPAEHYSGTVA